MENYNTEERNTQIKKDLNIDPFFPLITEVILRKIFGNVNVEVHKANPQEVSKSTDNNKEKDLQFYIQKVGERAGWKLEKTRNLLNKLDEIYPIIAFSLILREIAVDLDRKYKDHIEESPEIFMVNSLNGKIVQMDKKSIQTYRHFAAFRCIEDAKIACRILSPIMKDLFSNDKKRQ